ncbi:MULTISPECIES: aminodeoxychorismate synthase component I [unclassified Methylophaga]|mgnify:CR=1 FL=1|uniref:aminodeoxychorismate synthase component I n=1 Tax=unclassified Methylophaga TaxID=2629249 RepID=UPI000C8B04DD|nr:MULTISPECIES: aminodeoxychorismate synthase component I [unclassified Methylophaga]MBN47078.1 aminodeoxychorismate synthase, component I [Methylophaga sp.]|tara:strand:- start:118404 stop:119789 length:1386 start_codon:yes stop_codon:yes gene_type:complete
MTSQLPTLCAELTYQTDSATLFAAIRDLPWAVFLDSSMTEGENGRFDIISADPFITLQTRDQTTAIQYRNTDSSQSAEDPFLLLQQILQQYPQPSNELPFCGGAIGYFGYDLGRRIENLPSLAVDSEQIPEMAVGIYDWAVINDHQQQRCWLVSHGLDPHTQQYWPELLNRLQTPAQSGSSTFNVFGELRCNMDQQTYQTAFQQIKNYITEGDCYQVNLAKRYEIEADGDPWTAYQQLRQQNAAPFSAFITTPDATILSSSPERLLRVKNRQVETKPIKGTRPRDLQNPVRDRLLARQLQNSLKDRAENVMIVDLLRNDLGKVCEPGSISVPTPFALESFATVHHLVSTITGVLAEDQDAVSLLRACFPGGSITGAPKMRAMEIIEELEPQRRGVYCGSVAYIGFDGNMDSNITIRTLVFSDRRLRFWAGGGIVADSELAAEYQEVADKAAAMLGLVESLR